MRAMLSVEPAPASALVFAEIDDPVPGAGEIRIVVEACGLNYPDVLMVDDRYQFRFERPFSPGIEVAGTIEAIGSGVPQAAIGQRIVAQVDCGGLAEKCLVRFDRAHALPDAVSAQQAAGMLLTYATSYHALRDRAMLRAGETLLVLGAGGGVGLAAIELGKMIGARVVAAVSDEGKAALVRRAGADEVMLYPAVPGDQQALAAAFKQACPGGADVIYDPVGGGYMIPALRAIAREGRYLVVGFAAGVPQIPANLVLLKACQIVGVFWGDYAAQNPDHARKLTGELLGLVESGALAPLAPTVFPLADARTALTSLADRSAVGKLVVECQL